ncbi:putative transcriptional regulatory protein C1F7.11c [Hypsizygus marmoreus]|uniref:Transcriptional regulatory protein C1F7.11c n=1 Tax=Hypsizygus marmoreus TaxID=39966 RepID=A0A369JNN4_HYPMA|nr:putative transcriptional regulatory protein C1F7.11c [Hypsizygus marmoreus]
MSVINPYQRSAHGESSTSSAASVKERNASESEFNIGNIRLTSKATRRMRGEIACAECRRLKIRCDKTVPCSTCVKRGCAALCPNGTIPPGEGGRFVLAATDHLRNKMAKMEARMHALEDALAIIQASSSDRPHPLLSCLEDEEEEEEPAILKPVNEETEPSVLSDTLGALHIDRQGASRFFGPSGGSESLLLKARDLELQSHAKARRPHLQELDPSYLPPEVNDCYRSFPFSTPGVHAAAVQKSIEAFLPPVEHAIYLCDTFLEHLSWMFHIVSRQQMVKELIPMVYRQVDITYGPHDLALMLIVLGIGSLVDLNLQPYNLEAQHYYRLARAAVALQPVLGEQSVVTIKVLHLMSIYNGMSGKESNLEQSYALLDLASQVALRIGFHIDPSLWGFQGKEAYERRVYFWNLMSGVLWQSLVTGRPPALLTTYIDCHIPTAEDEALYQQGEVPLGFGIWGFRASIECMIPLAKTTLAVKPPSYQAILDLDYKIRNLIQVPKTDGCQEDRTAVSMQTFVRSHYQDLMLMFLHRAFFAQAMSEHPLDPLQSPYGKSVSAAYASACVVLDDTRTQFYKKPLLCARVWRIWSLAFSATIIIGTIAIRGLHLNLSPPAFEQFESACEIFGSAAETSSRAARAMPILQVMLQKAYEARERYNQRREPVLHETQAEDELSIFSGRTRLVNPEQSLASPVIGPSVLKPHSGSSNRTYVEPTAFHPPPPRPSMLSPHSLEQTLLHGETLLPEGSLDNLQATFADLSGGWEGLFYEIPQPPGNSSSIQGSGEGAMLDDRWTSFMHNYSILTEPTPQYPQMYPNPR